MEAAQGDPQKAEVLAQAEALLEELKVALNHYGPEARGLIAYLEPEDYQAWRWRIAQAIIALRGE